jgi:ferric-dicitrate binding protein FerR (iron transport regulator)
MTFSDSSDLAPDVLDRYLAGCASRAERDLVVRWIDADPARGPWLRAIAAQSRLAAREAPVDLPAMTARLHERLAREMGQAMGDRATASSLATSTKSTTRRAGTSRGLRHLVLRWAVAGVAGTIAAVAALDLVVSRSTPAAMREIVTHAGERVTVRLADGTRVTVGAGSRLRYPVTFTGRRTVVLDKGLAYFDVVHDPAHPFTVQARGAMVEELGTAFSVAASPQDASVRVVVADGRVLLRGRDMARAAGVTLSRGDLGIVRANASGVAAVTRQAVDVQNALAWVDGRLVFSATPMRDVLTTLEQWYGVTFAVADSSLLVGRVTGTFPGSSLNDILAQLAEVSDLTVERQGTRVVLTRAVHP